MAPRSHGQPRRQDCVSESEGSFVLRLNALTGNYSESVQGMFRVRQQV